MTKEHMKQGDIFAVWRRYPLSGVCDSEGETYERRVRQWLGTEHSVFDVLIIAAGARSWIQTWFETLTCHA